MSYENVSVMIELTTCCLFALKDFKAFYLVLVNLFYEFIKIIEFNFRSQVFFYVYANDLSINFTCQNQKYLLRSLSFFHLQLAESRCSSCPLRREW